MILVEQYAAHTDLLIMILVGQYAANTDLLNYACCYSVISESADSDVRSLMMISSEVRQILIYVALPILANLPVFSAPQNAWIAGKDLAFAIF